MTGVRGGTYAGTGMSDEVKSSEKHDAAQRVLPIARRPFTPLALRRLEERVELMRWSGHETDSDIAPGSLADQFWNGDVPRLINAAREALDVE